MLTYSGAQAFVDAVYAELRTEYNIPDCFVANDEPSGDFGIAHFWGLNQNGCAKLTFDDNRIATEYVVKHEIGHALSSLWNGGTSCGPMHEAWWRVRGFPGTAQQSQDKAIYLESIKVNSGYRFWPEEMFADTFGVVNTQYAYPLTDQMGIWLDQPAMRDFYKSLGGNVTDEQVKQAVVDALSSFGLDANTFTFIKERLAKDAHHQHALNGTVTTEPVEK